MTSPAITVGIPSYCGADDGEDDLLAMCLRAIRVRSCTEVDYEVVVVDDSGRAEHQAKSRVLSEKYGARWLCHETNRGISAAWNTLARAALAEDVVLLNDDFFVSRGWLEALTYFLRENSEAGSVGLFAYYVLHQDVPWILDGPDVETVPRHHETKCEMPEAAVEHTGRELPGRVMCPPGCAFAFTREKYDLVGGFDEVRYRQFYNESSFGTALAARGFPSYFLQWPACYTIMSATFGRSPELLPERDAFAVPRANYVAQWDGHTDVTHPRFMSRIPFQRVRWLDLDGPREAVITSEYGARPCVAAGSGGK